MGYFFLILAGVFFLAAVWLLYRRVRAAGGPQAVPLIPPPEPAAEDAEPESPRADAPEKPPGLSVGLVLLQRKPLLLDPEWIAQCVQRITGLQVSENDEDSDAFWALPPTDAVCPVMVRGCLYVVAAIAEPYAEDRDWYVDDETAPEMLSAWQKHRAWISISLAAPAPGRAGSEPLEFIGRLAAELADDETLAILHPSERHAVAFDHEVRAMLRRRPVKEVIAGPLRAFALLRKSPGTLTQQQLTLAVRRAWGVRLADKPSDGSFAVVVQNGFGFIEHAGIRLGIPISPQRYVRDVKAAAAEIGDLRLRRAFEDHTCWMGIDFVAGAVGISKTRVYQLLARLAAELLDDQTLLLFSPEYRRAVMADATLPAQLRLADPLQALFQLTKPPLLQVKRDEPAMEKAVAEARRRWPEFVAAFVSRKTTHRFAIKRGFVTPTDEHHEFMWVQVVDIQEDRITGILDNDPLYVQELKAGDRVVTRFEDVIDWIYTMDQTLVGNFTGPVILAAQKKLRD